MGICASVRIVYASHMLSITLGVDESRRIE